MGGAAIENQAKSAIPTAADNTSGFFLGSTGVFVGKSAGGFFQFANDAGGLNISGSNFNVSASGDVEARNMTLRDDILFTSGSSNAQIAKIGTVNINAHQVVGMDVGTTPSNPGGIAVRSPNNYEQIFIEGGATRYGGGTNPQIAMGLHYTTSDALIMKYDFNSASDEAGAQIFTYHGDEDSSDAHDIDNAQEYVRIQANLSGSVTICEDGLLAGTGGTNAGGVANGGVVSIGSGFDATKQELLGYGFYVNSDSMINGDLWLFSGNGNGSLGVGGIGPSGTTGEIKASADIVAFATSDIRLKENINPIQDALFKVRQLQGIEFDWKELDEDEKKKIHSHEGHDVGVIAQEVEKVLPEVVQKRENGYKAVKYEKMIPLLIESIKEQQEQIEELKKEVEELKNGSTS
tara:strand:- start:130 stop:1344 length:1215 start_codon:yes stop_codon:yes gene_type:complete